MTLYHTIDLLQLMPLAIVVNVFFPDLDFFNTNNLFSVFWYSEITHADL